jgi:hypothetical protein
MFMLLPQAAFVRILELHGTYIMLVVLGQTLARADHILNLKRLLLSALDKLFHN